MLIQVLTFNRFTAPLLLLHLTLKIIYTVLPVRSVHDWKYVLLQISSQGKENLKIVFVRDHTILPGLFFFFYSECLIVPLKFSQPDLSS